MSSASSQIIGKSSPSSFMDMLGKSMFLTVSLLIHMVLLVLFGGAVLFHAIPDNDNIMTGGGTDGGLIEEGNEFAAEPPGLEPETPSFDIPTAQQPDVSIATITTVGLSPNFTMQAVPVVDNSSMIRSIADSVASRHAASTKRSLAKGSRGKAGRGLGLGQDGLFKSSFFGLEQEATRVAFVVDYSGSMTGGREALMRKELAKSVEELPDGAQYALIFFAGPVWLAGEVDHNNTAREWKRTIGEGWKPINKNVVPEAKWLTSSKAQRKRSFKQIEKTPLTTGTDWLPPLQVAMAMDPPPDAIYLMTDGSPQDPNEDIVIDFVRKIRRESDKAITFSTIALGEPKAEKALKKIASVGGGKFRLVDLKADAKK